MKALNKLVIASLTALVVSNNANAEEIIFSHYDLNAAINQSVAVAVTQINTLDIQAATKQQIATMNQNGRNLLAMTQTQDDKKIAPIAASE